VAEGRVRVTFLNLLHTLSQGLIQPLVAGAGLIVVPFLCEVRLKAAPFPAEIMVLEARVTNSAPEAFESFGHDVDLSGNTAAIASIGRVDLFRRNSGAWENIAILSPWTDPSRHDSFGEAIALDGETLAVLDSDKVHVFRESPEPALNAWNTADLTTGSGVFYQYRRALDPSLHALAARGWTLTIKARMIEDFGGSQSCFVDFANSTERFLLFFDLDGGGNLIVTLGGHEEIALTTDGRGWAHYFEHKIVHDPDSNTADYYFNGVKMNTSPWPPTPITGLNGVRFGNGSTAGMGSMNWHEVELKATEGEIVLAAYRARTSESGLNDLDPGVQGWAFAPGNAGTGVTQGPVLADALTKWRSEAILPASGESQSIDLEGDRLLVGGFGEEDSSIESVLFFYQREANRWVLRQEVSPPESRPGQTFGESVSLSGDRLAVTDPGSDAAYIYVLEEGRWVYQAELLPDDFLGLYGASIDITGDRVVVGASRLPKEVGQPEVILLEHTGTEWAEVERFTEPGWGFGTSAAVQGDAVIIGRSTQDPGEHFVYTPDGSGEWILVNTREYLREEEGIPDPVVRDVAIDGENILIGVQDVEVQGGAGYLYHLDYGNVAGLEKYARKQLYFNDAKDSRTYDPFHTAFRYRDLLYREDSGGNIRARFDTIDEFYGKAELDTSRIVEGELIKGFAVNPDSPVLANLVLDIYHDRTVAAALLGRPVIEDAEYARFGLALDAPLPPNGFLIDVEIPLYRRALATNRNVLKEYFSLLTDNLGISSEPPLGYRIFRDHVPGRALESATSTNSMGESVPVTGQGVLFDGYRDLVLLFQLLRDHGQSAETLARLLIGRDSTGDRSEAASLISHTQRFLLLHGEALRGMFEGLPPEDDPSGLAHAIRGWEDGLEALTYLEQILSGGGNVLGFGDDFLMYVQKFSGQSELFDSYDALRARLDPTAGENPLRNATGALQAALDAYADYRGHEDQLAEQFEHSSVTYADRLRDIVGMFPDNPAYHENPAGLPGSELDQQYRSIGVARLQIRRNQVEIENVNREIQIELNKASAISNAVIDFGSRQAALTEEISHWNAAQAGANALADALSPEKLLTGRLVGYVINAAVQTGAEVRKGALEAQKEELAALQQATITGIESQATVETLALRLGTLAVDSQQTALLLQQEMNRFVALQREKADLEQKIAEQDAATASRYFADPIHRVGLIAEMAQANLTFEEAQKWLYFLLRAFEYKWNTRLQNVEYPRGSGRRWSTATLFKMRNADELREMFNAIVNYENQLQLARDDYFDWFSVRDDFFGYRLTDELGQPSVHADPISGELVDGLTAFRSRLRQLQDSQGNILIRFSTVREVPGGTFFRGPRFGSEGQVISKGLFLDKIKWIKINLPGDHTVSRSQISGELRYGGTSFIRNFDVGTYAPGRPDRLQDELTSYSTRFWFLHEPTQAWRFTDALSSTVTMQLSADPRTPPTVQEIDVFKERSVATSEWLLTIFTRDFGQTVLNIEELEDVELYFYHYAVTRP
jgi:hypothetical protein